MPLTTRCRHCGRLFPVHAQQLKERRGRVDCPQCGKRFDAIAGLLDEAIPAGEAQRGRAGKRTNRPPEVTAHADMLDLSEDRPKAGRAWTLLWSLGILFLIAGLVLQMAWWDRGRWLGQPLMQTKVEAVCKRIGCRLEPPRVAGAIEVRRPTLSEHSKVPGGLRLTLTLVNKTAVSQRLPQLQLELYDQLAKLAAARRFRPREYLPGARYLNGLAPGKAIRPVLDLGPPPASAYAFRVKLF